jgi:hypothetical protein
MIGLFPAILLGTSIVVLGFYLVVQALRRSQKPTVSIDEYSKAQKALDAMFIQRAAIERVFSIEDFKFIARTGNDDARRLFSKERKRLALLWLRKTQKQVAELMDLHLRLANYTHDPNPGFELELNAKYVAFVVVSKLVLLLLWVAGPFMATRTIAYTIRLTGDFCTVFSLRLERVNPTRLSSDVEYLLH